MNGRSAWRDASKKNFRNSGRETLTKANKRLIFGINKETRSCLHNFIMLVRQLFSRRVGYAAHVLCLMVQTQPPGTVPLMDLARQMKRAWPRTSASYLSKVVQALVEAKILSSVRGSVGGYCLVPRASAVSLLDVVCALEGTLDGRCPLTPSGPCEFRPSCKNHSLLLQLQHDFSRLLSQITIEQLASNLPRSVPAADAVAACAKTLISSPRPCGPIGSSETKPTFNHSHLGVGPAATQALG